MGYTTTMKKYLICYFSLALMIPGCTVDVPDYVSETDGESTYWTNAYGDSVKDIGIYVHYEHDKVVAGISFYAAPDSFEYVSDMLISINEYHEQDSLIDFVYGEFPGTDKKYFAGPSYAHVRDSVISDCRKLSCEEISFTAARTYGVAEAELPEILEVWYSFTTTSGSHNGRAKFKKITREREEVMRIH